jgi:uncharacterized membrane protein YhaH (DUF805 family)
MDYILKYSKAIITAIVAIAILSGLARIFSYRVGYYILLAAVILYFIYRLFYFTIISIKHKRLDKVDKQHLAIFFVLLIVIVFNNFNLLDAPFISLFLLMVDYLISLQPVKTKTENDDE